MDEKLALEPRSAQGSATWLLGVASALVAVSAVALSGGIVLNIIGYLLASVFAFTLIAIFRRRSLERSANAGIGVPHWMNLAAAGVLLIGFILSVAHSWFIASYLS